MLNNAWKFGMSLFVLIIGKHESYPGDLSKSYGEKCFFEVSNFPENKEEGDCVYVGGGVF